MLCEGDPLGVIVVGWAEAGPVPKAQEELLKTFADQAVIAIENTRLLNDLRESLQQQTATADVLKTISRSTFDLQAVLETLVASAVHLCEADTGTIRRREGDSFPMAATFGLTAEQRDYFARYSTKPDRGSVFGRTILEGRAVHVPDILADPEYNRPRREASVLVRAGLGVPLVREGTVIGVFSLQRREARPYSQKQIELVETFADQAVIAIENVRLFEEVQQRTRDLSESLEQQTATSEVLKVISSSPGELEPVFNAMLANATRICEATFGNLILCEGPIFRAVAVHSKQSYVDYWRQNPVIDLRDNPGIPLARLASSKQVVHITDLRTDQSYIGKSARIINLVEVAGARTLLSVPMLKEDELIGAIVIYRQEVRPFTKKQIELLTNFAAQAVIAIENTRLLNELRESLQQQTATADVLKVISSSAGELQPVFEAMLENAVRICGAKFGNLLLCEGDAFRFVTSYGASEKYLEYRQQVPVFRPPSGSHLNRVKQTKQVIHIADMHTEGVVATTAIVQLAGARTLIAVPMLKDNELVGIIGIYRQEVRLFTDKQIELVQNFAAQAVIAIENTRLLNDLRTRTNELAQSVGELRALGEVSQAVNSTLDIEAVLATIVGRAVQLSRTDAGAIYVFDEGSEEFRLHATYGMSEIMIAAISHQHIRLGDRNNIAVATSQREPIQVPDMRDEPASPVNEIILREGYRSILIIPLLRPDHIVGALVVRRKTPGEFPRSTVDSLQTFADQSVVAIQNARLFESVEARTRELAASLEELRTTQDRLVQTQKLASLGQLTAGIAHEIKNPLNFVNNFSGVSVELIDELQETLGNIKADEKILAEITGLTNTLRGNLDKIVQHGKRADAIVKNMLLHSREGSGEHRPVDINALVEESLNLAYHGARAEKQGFNITLERSLDPAAGEVDVFPQDITRVLLNLISNGFYAATKRNAQANGGNYEPTLAAATRNLGDRVEIKIWDNGTGIAPDVKEKMFNPFYTTKAAGEGTGLGLSISHDIIVKQHGGSIEVDTQPGEFTEIKIILPRVAVTLAESEERA